MKPAHTVRVIGPLRSRISVLAHSLAMAHENALRASLMARVQAAADSGASIDELHTLVDKLEAAPTDSRLLEPGADVGPADARPARR